MEHYREFIDFLSRNDALQAFKVLCTMIENDDLDSVKADRQWGEYIHKQTNRDYKHILALAEGYFNTHYKLDEIPVMYSKFDRLYKENKG